MLIDVYLPPGGPPTFLPSERAARRLLSISDVHRPRVDYVADRLVLSGMVLTAGAVMAIRLVGRCVFEETPGRRIHRGDP